MAYSLRNLIKLLSKDGDLKAKISRGVFWSFLGTLISKGLGVIGFIVIARILSIEDYGKLGIIRSTITTFAMFSVASFGVTATKYIAIYSQIDVRKVSRIITMTRSFVFILSLIISTTVFFFSEYIALQILKEQSLEYAVRLTAPTIFFTAMNGLQNGILSGFEKFKYIANVNIISGVLGIPILIFLTYFYGLNGAFYAVLINSFLLWNTSLFFVLNVLRKNRVTFNFQKISKEFYIIKEFTFPAFLSGMIVTPVVLISNLILTNFENGYENLGIYTAALNVSIVTITLNGVIGNVLYPYAMKFFKAENRKFEFTNLVLPFLIGVVLNLPVLVFPDIIASVYGAKYEKSQMYFSLVFISLSTIIIAHRQGISRNFAAANYMWWSLLGNIIWGLFAIASMYYLVEYGAVGRSLAFTFAYFANTIIFIPLYLNKKLIKKGLIISWNSFGVWLTIIMSSLVTIITESLFVRIVYITLVLVLIIFFVKNWYIIYVTKTNNL